MTSIRTWTALSPEELKALTAASRDVLDEHHQHTQTEIGSGFQVVGRDFKTIIRCRVAVSEDSISEDGTPVEGATYIMVWLHDADQNVIAIAEYFDSFSTHTSYALRKFFATTPESCLYPVHVYIRQIVELYRPDVKEFGTITYS